MQPYTVVPSRGANQEDEWIRLGVAAQVENKLPEAQKYYQQALRLDPCNAIATQNLAIVYAQGKQLNEALLAIERAMLFDPEQVLVFVNRALICLEADHLDDAIEFARKAVSRYPVNGPVLSPLEQEAYLKSRQALAMTLATAGHPEEAYALYQEMLAVDPQHPVAQPNRCFVQTLMRATPKDLAAARRYWYQNNRYTGEKRPHPNTREWTRPLKVGYVGGDFKTHSASMIFGRVMLHHSEAIIPYLYSSVRMDPGADLKSKQFMDVLGARVRDISTLTDEQAEAVIRQDEIDVLVELAGHTDGGRLRLFTRKPAPIQVSAWGFAHGTGCPDIEYFLADPIAVPHEERQFYVEQIVDLPCIVSYDVPTDYHLKGTSLPPYHTNEYVTFGCYARFEKLSQECLETFAEILRRVPGSTLQFKDHAFRRPYSIRRVLSVLKDIAPERLMFSLTSSHQDHMLAYQQCDLALDPFPHGGGVVALEQLYMGVPLLTLYGTQPSGRTAASVLTTLGHTDWIANSPEEYIEKAVALTANPLALGRHRKTLRQEFVESPVVKGYVEATEAAYRTMWQKWCTA